MIQHWMEYSFWEIFFLFFSQFIIWSLFHTFFFSVGQEPDIPDLIDYMQSGDEVKIINAAGYLQHLCYSKEYVKDKVRYSTFFCHI